MLFRSGLSVVLVELAGLSVVLVELAELVPEQQRQDGVWPQAEVRGPQALVEPRRTLLPQRLREAVSESPIKLSLKDRSCLSVWRGTVQD